MSKALRVIFLGTPAFALPSLEGIVRSGATLCAVVCQPDRPRGRGQQLLPPPVKTWAQEREIPVLQPEKVRNGRLADLLRPFNPDLLVVTAYGRILPKDVLELAPHGAINAHASLLPKFRGAAPIQWAIAEGEKESGITVMQMDEGLDTGDMLLVRKTPIGPEETSVELSERLAALAGEALEAAISELARGGLKASPQDDSQASLAPLLRREDAWLDFCRPAQELVNRIRGFQPWPGALIFHEGRPIKVFKAQAGNTNESAEPGTVLALGESVSIACAEGSLELLEVQPEGRRRMAARDFLAGYALKVGERLELRSA